MLGGDVVAGLDPVAPRDRGGPTEVLHNGQITYPANDRAQSEAESRHVECWPDREAHHPHPDGAAHDAPDETTHDREAATERRQSRKYRRSGLDGVDDRRRGRQVTRADDRPDQAPGEGGLVLEGVKSPPTHLTGRQPSTRGEAEGRKHTMEGKSEGSPIPERDGGI